MGESLLPLNGFQQMMLRWEQHLPLNAMHLVELKSGPDSRVVADCLSAACSMLGLRRVCVDGAGRNLLWESPLASRTVPAPQVALRSLATAGYENLSRVLNCELNERFESGMHWPVRAVQIEQDNHTTFLGLVYHHLVTDARGISLLMREWLRRLGDHSFEGASQQFEYSSPATESADRTGWKQGIAGLARTAQDLVTLMRCRRPMPDFQTSRRIQAGFHETSARLSLLKGYARVFGATVGELVLAALFEALTLLLQERPRGQVPMALCLPVDLRNPAEQETGVFLGQMLGSLTVQDTGSVGESFSGRVSRIAAKVRTLKQSGRAAGHSMQMKVMSRLWDLAPDWVNRKTGPALIPLAGCLSNVNFTQFMMSEVQSGLLRAYHRFSGTGPLVPLMISLTTLPSTMSLTTSHHSDVFSDNQITRLMTHVRLRIQGELPDQSSRLLYNSLPEQGGFELAPQREWSRAA